MPCQIFKHLNAKFDLFWNKIACLFREKTTHIPGAREKRYKLWSHSTVVVLVLVFPKLHTWILSTDHCFQLTLHIYHHILWYFLQEVQGSNWSLCSAALQMPSLCNHVIYLIFVPVFPVRLSFSIEYCPVSDMRCRIDTVRTLEKQTYRHPRLKTFTESSMWLLGMLNTS